MQEIENIEYYTASHKFATMSAQKIRAFADLIRDKYADDAMNLLSCYPNRGARLLEAVVKSAMANAEDRNSPDADSLMVLDVRIDSGPMTKRFRPKSRGMSSVIKKRMCHIKVTLG